MHLRLDLLARCATRTTDGEPLSLCRYAYPTNPTDIPGLLDFHRLEQVHSTRSAPSQDRSPRPSAPNRSSSGSWRTSARTRAQQDRSTPQRTHRLSHARPAPILFMPDEFVADTDQSSISLQSEYADDSDYCEDEDEDDDYEIGTGADDPLEKPPMDTDNVVSVQPDSSLNLQSMAVMTDDQLIAMGATDPTISLLQDRKSVV